MSCRPVSKYVMKTLSTTTAAKAMTGKNVVITTGHAGRLKDK